MNLPGAYGQVQAILEAQGVDPERAWSIVLALGEEFSGRQPYFPQLSDILARETRDVEICAEFNGSNHAFLAGKHGVAVSYIYRIVKKGFKTEGD